MNEIRELFLEILDNVFKTDITATQQMGVSLSNSMKKDGVVIIQNQNVEVLSHIVPLITKGIRLCENTPKTEILEITQNPLDSICQYFYDRHTDWQGMQQTMKDAYMSYVLQKYTTKSAAAKFLGVGPTYLSKLTGETTCLPK